MVMVLAERGLRRPADHRRTRPAVRPRRGDHGGGGGQREAARRPVMPQINIKPWNPTGIMQV